MAKTSKSSKQLPEWAKPAFFTLLIVYVFIAALAWYIGGLDNVVSFIVFGAAFFAYLSFRSDGMGLFDWQIRDIPLYLTRMIFRLAMIAILLWGAIYMLG